LKSRDDRATFGIPKGDKHPVVRVGVPLAKPKIRMTLKGSTIAAPVWKRDDIHWEGSSIGCPYCSAIKRGKAIIDIIQYGLIDHDLVITVFECRACKKMFGVQYIFVHEDLSVEEYA